MTSAPVPLLPLSRPTSVDAIPDLGLRIALSSTDTERAALARLNGLVEITSLSAALLLRREARAGVWVTGEVTAAVVQTCVVSLEPFAATVQENVDVHFLTEEALEAFRVAQAKRAPDPSDDENPEDEPDPILDGRIDLGVLVAEHLTLGLDPYPRKPGADFSAIAPTIDDADKEASPFAVLKTLRQDDV